MTSLPAKIVLAAAVMLTTLTAVGDDLRGAPSWPTDEFHFVRMYYNNAGGYGGGFRGGYGRGSFDTDFPEAEEHFTMGVRRLTRVDIGDRARLIQVGDDMLFDYPWLYAVTPHWRGIYDDKGRLMVAINFNMDLGDAWELANEP